MASIAPTVGGKATDSASQGKSSSAPVAVIPFTRSSRKKSRLIGQYGPTVLNAGVQALAPIQIPAAGYLRRILLTVKGVTAANAAAVTFNADGPFNVLQQISLLSPNGDTIISVIDGFTLYALIKYGAFSTGRYDPLGDPTYSVTPGAGATGGSFVFTMRIPVELDARDAFCALQNMAANQSFLLQLSLNSTAALYGVAPTAAPSVTITAVMEYWSAPAASNGNNDPQATSPIGLGSVSLIQTQTPPIVPNAQQNIQLLNVGNTIRFALFILRTAGNVRTEADWPTVTNFYVNGDPWYYKQKDQWRSQMAQEYDYDAGVTATPTLNSMDAGVYILTDFMNDGASGDGNVDGAANRDLLLVTSSGTAFNIEAVSWGAAAGSLFVVENVIRPSSPQALYAPKWI
jgi:hypothetical protein